jgi:exopolyphosphatase/guanosine-5'-triphosphate,3'-diphosphate pyrophosphatase
MTPAVPSQLAAVDLGSNSFHLLVAREVGGQIQVVDRVRERVALAEGLDSKGNVDAASQERALACLRRMGERLRDLPEGAVRAVGTNSMRRARNSREFLPGWEAALGHPIEVISGREEARLVYLGVAFDVAAPGRRLVVDIGGGSTECIVGERFEIVESDSLYMGCVSYSLAYFPGGLIDKERIRNATLAARVELEPIEQRYQRIGWDQVFGCSGTIMAVADVLKAQGWGDGTITRKGLTRLEKALIGFGRGDRVVLGGLPPDRGPILAGGLSILGGVFDALEIEAMSVSGAGLREGLIHDTLGRRRRDDVRDATVGRFVERYHVDRDHAARVERTAISLFDDLRESWALDEDDRYFLGWAARLHEIGLFVSYSGFHKHGAYIAANSEMPGFSRGDQAILSALILCHRRRLDRARVAAVPGGQEEKTLRLALLLRLAVVLNRARTDTRPARVQASTKRSSVRLRFAKDWLDLHPLCAADLAAEALSWEAVGYTLTVR